MTNVVFMMADELSWWALEHAQMPNLERLRDRGTNFTNAYTPSPICVPTRAAIATGKEVHEIGCWSSAEAYDGTERSWGHALQDAGVAPVSIRKLHCRSGADDTGFVEQIERVHILNGEGWVQALLRNPTAHTLARQTRRPLQIKPNVSRPKAGQRPFRRKKCLITPRQTVGNGETDDLRPNRRTIDDRRYGTLFCGKRDLPT
ncbi:sulfatase-like hydrolase/transferase [Ascidiaceihabitans donghaensis]|uniref:sulfatase-like hydrolase/transferase n=1 Tax=Ascidiaceihabitans donghaensis TaxID=1510460 RepID=UPI000D54F773|nr:sulfatase-like hydrolase/transferase [Ascidiaceihabitans donghaensis]